MVWFLYFHCFIPFESPRAGREWGRAAPWPPETLRRAQGTCQRPQGGSEPAVSSRAARLLWPTRGNASPHTLRAAQACPERPPHAPTACPETSRGCTAAAEPRQRSRSAGRGRDEGRKGEEGEEGGGAGHHPSRGTAVRSSPPSRVRPPSPPRETPEPEASRRGSGVRGKPAGAAIFLPRLPP